MLYFKIIYKCLVESTGFTDCIKRYFSSNIFYLLKMFSNIIIEGFDYGLEVENPVVIFIIVPQTFPALCETK